MRDLEAGGYLRRNESSRYGWYRTQTLTLAEASVVTVRWESEAEVEVEGAAG